jgi:hypothetical protein
MGYTTREKPTNALGDLIDEIRRANDWSEERVVQNATRAGAKLGRSNLNGLATQLPLGGIQRETVQAISDGLGISPDRVALAAMQAMGFRPPVGLVSAAEAVQRDPSLSKENQAILLTILRTARDTQAG